MKSNNNQKVLYKFRIKIQDTFQDEIMLEYKREQNKLTYCLFSELINKLNFRDRKGSVEAKGEREREL